MIKYIIDWYKIHLQIYENKWIQLEKQKFCSINYFLIIILRCLYKTCSYYYNNVIIIWFYLSYFNIPLINGLS